MKERNEESIAEQLTGDCVIPVFVAQRYKPNLQVFHSELIVDKHSDALARFNQLSWGTAYDQDSESAQR